MKVLIYFLLLFSLRVQAENDGGSGGDHTDGNVTSFPYPQCLSKALENINLKLEGNYKSIFNDKNGNETWRGTRMRVCQDLCDSDWVEYGGYPDNGFPNGSGSLILSIAQNSSYLPVEVPKMLRDLIAAEIKLLDTNRDDNFLYINIDKFLVLGGANLPRKGDTIDFWGATTFREKGAPIYFTNSSTWLKKVKNNEVDLNSCEQIEDLELTILQEVMDHVIPLEESKNLTVKDLISPELSKIPFSDHLNYSIAYHVTYQSFVGDQDEFKDIKLPGLRFYPYVQFLNRAFIYPVK